jgi:hypothetical protein
MLEDSYKSTNKLLKNITNTSGTCTEINFSDLCDEAYMKIRHGGMSMNQAIVEIIDGLSKKGLVVQYAGRVDSIETALTRAVRTAINQANARIVLQGCAEMGVSFVKVSEHLGARVTGTGDYRDHSWWQGKVYSLDWSKSALAGYEPSNKIPSKMEYISQIRDVATRKTVEEYQDFTEACGYGEMLGICGINCRHTFHAWYPDINIDRGPQIDPEENAKRYELEQKAREMERSIRKDRRELNVKDIEINNLPEGIEKDQAQARFDELSYRVTDKTNTYNEFIRVNKLGNSSSRLDVGGFKENVSKVNKGVRSELTKQIEGSRVEGQIISKKKELTEVREYAFFNNASLEIIKENIGEVNSLVLLTDEREIHIKNGDHPQDYEFFIKYGKSVIECPEIIMQSKKDDKTLLLLRHIEDTNVNVVVKLSLLSEDSLENSIITSHRVGDRSLRKLMKKNKVLYKKDFTE